METLVYSKFYKPKKSWSKIVPGLRVTDCDAGKLRCPRCKASNPNIPNGETRRCHYCDLVMKRLGNALYISEEEI